MLQRCDNVLEAKGETPLIRVHRIVEGLLAPIYAKIEFVNPGGSVQDLIAQAIVEQAEADGRLKPDGTFVKATSGNTGSDSGTIRSTMIRTRSSPPSYRLDRSP